jgi:hypothetical protein
LHRCADRPLVALVSTPDAVPFFATMGFLAEPHGHAALSLRPPGDATHFALSR